jgi:hypothetical protein
MWLSEPEGSENEGEFGDEVRKLWERVLGFKFDNDPEEAEQSKHFEDEVDGDEADDPSHAVGLSGLRNTQRLRSFARSAAAKWKKRGPRQSLASLRNSSMALTHRTKPVEIRKYGDSGEGPLFEFPAQEIVRFLKEVFNWGEDWITKNYAGILKITSNNYHGGARDHGGAGRGRGVSMQCIMHLKNLDLFTRRRSWMALLNLAQTLLSPEQLMHQQRLVEGGLAGDDAPMEEYLKLAKLLINASVPGAAQENRKFEQETLISRFQEQTADVISQARITV